MRIILLSLHRQTLKNNGIMVQSRKFNWDSKKDVLGLMSYYCCKLSQWSNVRELDVQEFNLWISLDCFLKTPSDSNYFVEVRKMLRDYLEN